MDFSSFSLVSSKLSMGLSKFNCPGGLRVVVFGFKSGSPWSVVFWGLVEVGLMLVWRAFARWNMMPATAGDLFWRRCIVLGFPAVEFSGVGSSRVALVSVAVMLLRTVYLNWLV